MPAAVLDDVFDDPAHGEPGRDRLAFHIIWEIVLLLGVAAVGYVLLREDSGALRGNALEQLLVAGAALGLLAVGAGLTLRAGAVNLALGPVAVAAALHFAENGDRGIVPTIAQAAVAALVLGLVVGIVVVGLPRARVGGQPRRGPRRPGVHPAPVRCRSTCRAGTTPATTRSTCSSASPSSAVLGGLLGTVKSVRRSVGRFRPVADPARRRGPVAAVLTGGAIALSMPLAAGAGVLIAASADGPVVPASGLEWTGLAVGAALLGGTSAYGRRGGVFGTVSRSRCSSSVSATSPSAAGTTSRPRSLGAGAVALGLVVTRLVETFGRPKSAGIDDTPWQTTTTAPPWPRRRGPIGERTDSWSSTLPAQPTESRADTWDTERWSGGDR